MAIHSTLSFTLLFAGSLLLCPALVPESRAATPDGGDLQNVITTYGRELAALTDDAQALGLFTSRLGPALDLKDYVAVLARQHPSPDRQGPSETMINDMTERALQLTKHLAVWRLVLGLLDAAEADPTSLERFLRDTEPQQAWLTGKDRRALGEARQLAAVLASVPIAETDETPPPKGYRDYAAAVDGAHIRFTGSNDSWLTITEAEGARGVLARLMEIGDLSGSDRAAYPTRFFNERLRPVLNAHLTARAIRAEAEAEQQTWEQWLRLRNLRESLREHRGLARLCGTWQWTIHNHQNHGEHKMFIVFPPPGVPPGAGLRPARTVVAGDTVYLRWEFDRGIVQEDSLLFSKEGQRLEGSFVNSGGAWGAITGKRTTDCGQDGGRSAPTGTGDPSGTPTPGKSNRR